METSTSSISPYQEAPPISPDLSTRQLNWVLGDLFLYAPAAVRREAYAHTNATENKIA